MKLAEALSRRADHQRRVEQLRQRLVRNAKVQEGEQPAEDPASLLDELNRTMDDLVDLIQRINRTNATTAFERDLTIADAIAKRNVLRLKHAIFRDLAEGATVTQDRHTKSEVKFKSTVKVSEIQKRADDLAREHRELDEKIQEANWQTELLK